MPAISKIRLTNVVYEHGQKRYHDELFLFDGLNGAIVLENGGGKTVFIQTVLQAVIPHASLADREIKNTLYLEESPAHIAIEWIDNENPRRYVVTAVTLHKKQNGIDSLRYVYEYGENDPHSITEMPFVKKTADGIRPSDRGEMADYYTDMEKTHSLNAKTFPKSIKSFTSYIEEQYQIIHSEWESMIKINGGEGDVEKFFDNCKKTNELVDRLLIPSVESVMEGFKEQGFAETFENRRAEFKKFKELKETIEQSKQLNNELKIYVDHFRKTEDKQLSYNEVRQQAKSYILMLEEEMLQIEQDLSSLEQQWQRYNEDMEEWELKSASLDIYKQWQRWQEFANKEQQLHAQRNELETKIETNRQHYYSLLFVEQRDVQEIEQAQLELVEQQLAQSEQQQEVADLQFQIEQVSAKIHYCFLVQKQQIEEQLKNLNETQTVLEQRQINLGQQQQGIQADISTQKEQQASAKTSLHHIKEQMQQIKAKLVARDEESIEYLLEQWIAQSTTLDNDNIEYKQRLKTIQNLLNEYEQQKEERLSSISRDGEIKATFEQQLNNMDQHQQSLLAQMAALRANWSHIPSIYEREQSSIEQIAGQIEKFERDKELKLIQERRAKRFIDDYEHQDSFFADPFVEQKLKDWSQNYYITMGIEFVQQHEEELKDNVYPFWASTVITTDKEKSSLIEKLKSVQHELTYPIYILSLDEAYQVGTDYESQKSVIEPFNWLDYQHPQTFLRYKEDMQEIAKLRENERKQTEVSLRQWQQLQQSLQEFLTKYPFSLFKETEEQLFNINQKIKNNQYKLENINNELQKLKQEHEAKQSTLATNNSILQDLNNHRIPQATDYVQLSKKLPSLENDIKRCDEQLHQLYEKQTNAQKNVEDVITQLDEIQGNISNLTYLKKYKIEEDVLYQTVRSFESTIHDEKIEVLKRQYESIEDEIKKIQKSRGELLERLKNCREKIEAAQKVMKAQLEKCPHLDQACAYPVDGAQQISTLRKQFNTMRDQQKEIEKKHTKAQVAANTEQWALDELRKKFVERFEQMWPIEGNVVGIEDQLKQQKQQLKNNARFMKQQQQQLTEQKKLNEGVVQIYNQYIMVYSLVDPTLVAQPLTQEQSNEFFYNKQTLTTQVISRLQQAQQQFEKACGTLADAKEEFIYFAERNIKDPTLRKTTIDGVKSKKTFAEILEHDQLMSERIENVIQLAENTMRDHDKELQQFITYIHTHIRKLRGDLLEIPKKTRVKVNDDWKTIYKIDVPDWDDDIAKEHIQDHINWTLSQLESDRYLDETGKEDGAKVQKFLQDSFKTVPILRMVLGNQFIKVKCRKVESAYHISKTFYTWEESNRWSGGEKWSKNMALFLGLLNFIAEKSQKITTHMKRNRTVILDNPFGKASSDHVLSPVFFIADQLGFQLITLTAHAEGKFLSDYFPIVYSCRLNFLEGQSKQVLTKEQTLQTAYLRDHAPERLVRLGEKQQLSFFE